jgi:hypothetical protein
MPSKWVEHIKEYAKANGMTYKSALSDPKCKEAYAKSKGSGVELPVKPEENISMVIEEKKTRGRPKKYATDEERKKAKTAKTIESNKRKRAEKKGEGIEIKPAVMPRMGKIGKIKIGMPNPLSDPAFAKKYAEEKAKAEGKGLLEELKKREIGKPNKVKEIAKQMERDAREAVIEGNNANPLNSPRPTRKGGRKTIQEAEGKGIIAGYSAEGHNGLTHIYPISHTHILEMFKHLI